ncbi:MAG: ATP-dependent DNA helicase [Chloroflexota bacterium]
MKVSVRQLVEFILQEGDLAPAGFQTGNRALEGTRGHQYVQKSRPAGYLAEVPIKHTVEQDGLTIEISGRVDGIYPDHDPVMLDEIKTTTRDLSDIGPDYNPLHWAQVKVYAYFYALQQDCQAITLQLTYFHIDTRSTIEFHQTLSLNDLQTFFEALIADYLVWAKALVAWLEKRDQSIQDLTFPYPEYRARQRDLAVAVYQAIRQKEICFAQAPTGIGKTIATLFPAIKAIGTGYNNKIFYLTAKTLGRTVAEKALDDMRETGLSLKSVTITAKDKMCFCPATDRSGDTCDYANNYYGKLRAALLDAFEQDAFTRPTIETLAEKHQVCPFEFSLDLSLWADCIICDYNYVFDPRVYLRRFFDQTVTPYTFLIDESHNLPDRARMMFSAEIEKRQVLDLQRMTKTEAPNVAKTLAKVNKVCLARRKQVEAEGQRSIVEHDLPSDLIDSLKLFVTEAEGWLILNQPAECRQTLLDFYFSCLAYLRTAERFDHTYVSYFERRGQSGLISKLYCLDPAPHLAEGLNRGQAAIFFSATLLPMDYFERLLTGAVHQPQIVLPSPFPKENLKLIIQNNISTKYAQREASYPQIAETIISVCTAHSGNYLVFFPSYAYMEAVIPLVEEQAPRLNLLIQARSMSEVEREAFLAEFEKGDSQTVVGFAVMGGIFGEGIDLVGNRLVGAIIVGVGIPQLGLERDLIKTYFQDVDQRGFEYAYQYPGLNRVMQAAGRVIRTETDRGVIILIDERFTQQRYRRLYPEGWQYFEAVRDTESLTVRLETFWLDRPILPNQP